MYTMRNFRFDGLEEEEEEEKSQVLLYTTAAAGSLSLSMDVMLLLLLLLLLQLCVCYSLTIDRLTLIQLLLKKKVHSQVIHCSCTLAYSRVYSVCITKV